MKGAHMTAATLPTAEAPPGARTDPLAIIAFIVSLTGLSPVAIVLGHVSLNRSKKRQLAGRGLAIIALVLGYLSAVLMTAVIIGSAIAYTASS